MKKAIQFGAGNIGRGFIGALLSKSGYHVTFVDVDNDILNAINKDKKYTIYVKDNVCSEEIIYNIDGFNANSESLFPVIAEAEIITTAVGANVLVYVARNILNGIKHKQKIKSKTPLTIIACENMIGATDTLKNEILNLADDRTKNYIEKFVSFPNSSVDRIVPPVKNQNIIDVTVESFFEWNVEKSAFKHDIPNIEGMNLVDNLNAFLERKLFTLNTGHAITAYLGYLKNYKTIDESIEDIEIETIVKNAMKESGYAICQKYNFDIDEHFKYIDKILNRFKNKYLQDDIIRVGREPLRKLSKNERLVKPLNTALKYNLKVDNLLIGIAATLFYNNKNDLQSINLQKDIKNLGILETLKLATEIENEEILNKIISNYHSLKNM